MYIKKNLWQRIKFAFQTLLSDAPLEELYAEGFQAGADELIKDYRLLKEKLLPLMEELTVPPQCLNDRIIAHPEISMLPLNLAEVGGIFEQMADVHSFPSSTVKIKRAVYTPDRVQFTCQSDLMAIQLQRDANYARRLEVERRIAAQRLGEYLLKNGFIKATRQPSPLSYEAKIMYWVLVYNKRH